MRKNKKAFSLIELLVVIAIIGILAGLSIVGVKAARERSRDARRITDLNRVQSAIMQYYTVEKSYPTIVGNYSQNYQNLDSAIPNKYLDPLPQDPGAKTYNYNLNTTTGTSFALWVNMETNNKFAKSSEDGGLPGAAHDAIYEVGYGDNWNLLVH